MRGAPASIHDKDLSRKQMKEQAYNQLLREMFKE